MIYSHTVPWPDTGLPVFLRRAAGRRRFLWESDRAGVSFAAFGVAATLTASGPDRFRRIRSAAADLLHGLSTTRDAGVPPEAARPRFVGGFPFLADPLSGENTADGIWREFGEAFFVLPRYLLSRTKQGSFLTACAAGGADDPWASKEALWDLPAPLDMPVLDFTPATAPPSDFTTRSDWAGSVRAVLSGIAGRRMRKVVLARAREFPVGANPVASLARLSARYPDCYRFLIEPEPGHTFFGATPELLVSKRDRSIETMALAGSSRRGRSLEEDVILGEQLAASEKDLFEHELVVRSVEGRLAPALGRMEIGQRELLRLSNIQHLCTPVTGEVLEGTGLLELVERLHPTPAVGGLPAEAALEIIAAAEPVSRGWYAGPVGWFDGHGDGEFAVALRSAVSDGARTRLYAGAGIVDGSDPDREWQEIELKFLPMMEALGCVPTG